MRSHLLLFIILFDFLPLFPQTVTIIDSEDNKPVSDVIISNSSRTKYVHSNKSGKADITILKGETTICFQHFTYDRKCISAQELEEARYIVRLSRKLFEIEEFVISASRHEERKNEVPNRVATISLPALEIQNPQTAADLIGISDEVFIQKSQLGGGNPMIRGFATNRVLIVVDGIRMNNAIYREGNIQNIISLDPSSVESTEIIFGPGAVVYGSDAIGGVMDFQTREPLFTGTEKPLFKADALMRFSSANKEKSFHFGFNAGSKKISFLTSLSWSDYDDLRMGSRKNNSYLRPEYVTRTGLNDTVVVNPDPRVQVSSGYSQVNMMNKLGIKISPDAQIIISNHFSRLSDVPRYDRLIQYRSGILRYGDWYYGPQEWMMNSIHLKTVRKTRLYDNAVIIAAHQRYKESRHDRGFGKALINEQAEKVTIFSLNADFDKSIRTGNETIRYGLEAVYNDIVSVAQTRNILSGATNAAGPRYPDGDNKYTGLSLYGGYKNNLFPSLTLNSGIRYNYTSLRSTIEDNSFYNFPFSEIDISGGALTGSAGMVWRVTDRFHSGINVSTGFRAPNLDDAGKVFDSAPGVVVVPNPGLKPEYAWNIDLSLSKEFGKVIHTELTLYHTWLNNAMVRNDFIFDGHDSINYLGEMSKVEAITNSGSAVVNGFSFNLQVNIMRHLSLKSALNLTEGYEENGDPLRHAAPLFGSTHLLLGTDKLEADLYSNYNGAKKHEKMAPSELEKSYMYAADKEGLPWSPGWITINYKMKYRIVSHITLMAGIENIFDVRYRPYSSGIVSAGRNLIFSLKVDF